MTIPSPQEINQWKEDAEKYLTMLKLVAGILDTDIDKLADVAMAKKKDAEKWDLISKDLEVEEAKNTLIVEQLRKLLGNTTKNPEHCCEAFEYLRDGLQKAMEGKE